MSKLSQIAPAEIMQTELLLIRHAPSRDGGRLAGRCDVDADCSDEAGFAALRAELGEVDHRIASPARRCLQTACALWPGLASPQTDARLWEQDFGAWEGLPFGEIPDLGPLSGTELAACRPPEGESFADLVCRAQPAVEALLGVSGRIAIVAHAGTVRACLAMALGEAAPALTFSIAPLSLTHLCHAPGHGWAVKRVNWTPGGDGR